MFFISGIWICELIPLCFAFGMLRLLCGPLQSALFHQLAVLHVYRYGLCNRNEQHFHMDCARRCVPSDPNHFENGIPVGHAAV